MALFKGPNLDGLKKRAGEGVQAAQAKAQAADLGSKLRKAASGAAAKADVAAKTLSDGVKELEVSAAGRAVSDMASSGFVAATRAIGLHVKPEAAADVEADDDGAAALIGLLCCFAAADGEISSVEVEKISAIVADLGEGPEGDPNRQLAVKEAIDRIDAEAKEFEYAVAAKVGALRLLEATPLSEQEKKSLCWNLYALAYSDGINESEIDFIRFVNEKTGINNAAAEELGAYAAALFEISEAKKKLEDTDRSYREIGPLVAELDKREQILLEAAMALVFSESE